MGKGVVRRYDMAPYGSSVGSSRVPAGMATNASLGNRWFNLIRKVAVGSLVSVDGVD